MLLSLVGAAAYHLNPYNYEAGWRPVYESVARQALEHRTKAADVLTEFDIYLDTKKISKDITSSLDTTASRACRPDLAIAYYGLVMRSGKYYLTMLQLAVIIELKRAPPRDLVSLAEGLPYDTNGQRAINRLLKQAQSQVSCQGALWLRTPAGKRLSEILLIAGTGPNATWTIMTSTNDLIHMDTWKLVSDCADYQAQEEEEALQSLFVEPPRSRRKNTPTLNRPPPSQGWTFKFSALLNVASPEFLLALNNYLDNFERKFREQFPDSFSVGMMPWYVFRGRLRRIFTESPLAE